MMKIINVGDRVMNTWIYEIPDGYVMIDTGYPGKLKNVEERMKRHGIQWSDIRYLFLTHAHDDHARKLLRSRIGERVVLSSADLSRIRRE